MMAFRPAYTSDAFKLLEGAHPATLDDDTLWAQIDVSTGRTRGPGGQHRNTTDSAVWLVHRPTGIETGASERRHQWENRHVAFKRLRVRLAIQCRTLVSRDHHQPSALWVARRQGERIAVNPDHHDYAPLLAEALDLVVCRRFDVAGAAGLFGVTMSQLTRLIRQEKHAFARLNEGRKSVGLPPLRS